MYYFRQNMRPYISDDVWGIGVVNVSEMVRAAGSTEEHNILIYDWIKNDIDRSH